MFTRIKSFYLRACMSAYNDKIEHREEQFMTTKEATRQNVNLSIERELLTKARDAGMNLSRTLSRAIDEELRRFAASRWQEENAEGINTLNRISEETGCFSDDYRNF